MEELEHIVDNGPAPLTWNNPQPRRVVVQERAPLGEAALPKKEKKKVIAPIVTNQKMYKVRLFRDFEFPAFSVNNSNVLEDLTYKSLDEVGENFQQENYFQIEVDQDLPFILNKKLAKIKGGNRHANFIVKEISLIETELKFGELDYVKNPHLFQVSEEFGDNLVESGIKLYVTDEIEQFFTSKVNLYSKSLQTKIPL